MQWYSLDNITKILIIRTIKIKSFIHKYNNNSYNKLS